MKTLFPWYGNKSRIAPLIWELIGDVPNLVIPFLGSGAELLARPAWHRGGVETVNDKNAFLANFFRAIKWHREELAAEMDWPVNQADLTARHRALVAVCGVQSCKHAWKDCGSADCQWSRTRRIMEDATYCHVRYAAWWCWGLRIWIGGGWCDGEWRHRGRQRGCGSQLPFLGVDYGVTPADELESIAARLRDVRVACGDWTKVVSSVSVTTFHGTTGVILDPPYSDDHSRCYAGNSDPRIAGEVREWCLSHADDPEMRIVLCGYEGEHDALGWRVVQWASQGNRGLRGVRGHANQKRECIWASPATIQRQRTLFA